MSAYIVDKITMDRVLTAIQRETLKPNGPQSFGGLPIVLLSQLTDLGRALFKMNRDAIEARYGDRDPADMPGPCDLSDIHDNYEFADQSNSTSEAQAAMSVRCLRYQCCEGDVDECELYKALDDLAEELKARPVHAAEAQAAEWG